MSDETRKESAVPNISLNSPLAVEKLEESYQESGVEKKGKAIFILGVIFAEVILIATWIVFSFYVKSF